jgi:type I restriction enzyme S subunit
VPEYWDGEIPWASVKDFNINSRWFSSTEKRISREGLGSCSSVLLEPGELVISARGTVGVISQPTMQTAFNQSNYGLRAKQGLADNDYLYYALVHANKALLGDTHGGMFDTITRSTLDRLLVPNPPLKEQRRIAEALGVFDEKIALNKELSKTLGNLAQSIFKSWFIDFDPVKAKLAGEKPVGMDDETASLFPDSMEESELGLIPTSWDVLPASELFEIGIGRTPPRKEPEWFSSGNIGVPWVSIRDMGTFGVFSHFTSECLTEAAVSKFRVPIVPAHTVLMCFKLTVGKLCITDRPLVTNEAIAHFRVPTEGRLDSNYAYLWLSQYDMRTLDSTSSIGTATNSGVIRNIKFLVPSEGVLVSFQKTIEPIFKNLKLLQEQSATLAELRDSLLPRLVSGELEIPEEMLAS